jgi:hypothetical protein
MQYPFILRNTSNGDLRMMTDLRYTHATYSEVQKDTQATVYIELQM